jgi:hypothetical protein
MVRTGSLNKVNRHNSEQLAAWHRDGVVVLDNFFSPIEVQEVARDIDQVFERPADKAALDNKESGAMGNFHPSQFRYFDNIPFDCSPALNLIMLHPSLISLAREALGAAEVTLYQAQAWAKFTGESDYDQPFHCDYINHTLTYPSAEERKNSITFLCYMSDVSEGHGPVHYVTRPDSDKAIGPGPRSSVTDDELTALAGYERSGTAGAGSVFAYGIDVFHRGTNLTIPGAYRYAFSSCFKARGNDAIGYTAWPYHHTKPWDRVFDHATPDQLACLGVPRPGDSFWTEHTLSGVQRRYPNWDLTVYRDDLS